MLAAVIAIVGRRHRLLVAGGAGLIGALVGAALAAVFLGLTAVSILIAGRVTKGDVSNPIFFAIVLGAWLLKFIVFLVFAILLRGTRPGSTRSCFFVHRHRGCHRLAGRATSSRSPGRGFRTSATSSCRASRPESA